MTGKINISKGEFPGQGEVLIYTIAEDNFKKEEQLQILDKKTQGKLSKKLELYEFKGKEDELVSLEADSFYKNIIVVGAGRAKDFTLTKWRKLLANAFRKSATLKYKSATVGYSDLLGKNYSEIGENATLAFYLVNYRFDFYKNEEEKKKNNKLEGLIILTPNSTDSVREKALEQGVEYGKILASGIYLTRDLVNQPASHTHPDILVEEAFKIEKESQRKVKVEILDDAECRKLGMGAFLGVAQGSEKAPRFIILHYAGVGAKKKKICLVGKSITFDSGGLSLKPAKSMETMKMDMAGGATVLGVFKILATLPHMEQNEVYGILPACENMPSGRALRPGDILTALNKKTIEVLNTDAEGRLALADGLSYAEKYLKPDVIIDIATLTGACMVALGVEITGLFGNDKNTVSTFEKIARGQGEELWQLPLYKPYAKGLKSDVANIKNITGQGYGGAITAALFLSEFVKKTKWLHLDIAGPAFNEDGVKDVTPKGATAWGVLTITEFLEKYVT